MSASDPTTALGTLAIEYVTRTATIRRGLTRSHSPNFAEQAMQCQNDEALEGLLTGTEAGVRQVGLAHLHLAEGRCGCCEYCGEVIEPTHLVALPMTKYCPRCVDLIHQ